MAGVAAVAWAVPMALQSDPSSTRFALVGFLTIAALACSQFPISLGVKATFLTLDSIPLVLAIVLLPMQDAILIGAVTTAVTVLMQPAHAGWQGGFWRLHATAAAAVAMAGGSWLSTSVLEITDRPEAVLALPAFVVALVFEVAFDLAVLVEMEAVEPGSGRQILDALVVPAANVVLPMVVTAVITPYIDDPVMFSMLLPLSLFGMYGALWVANSQQFEKRRGEHLKDSFSRYVPESVVDANLDAMQRAELGGEQREITVLFCDIRGFTSWAEQHEAGEVITELNALLSELSAAVMETAGTLDKFTGDGLMAFWGAPVLAEDHANRACIAALDMLDRLSRHNKLLHEAGHHCFSIGIGVHSGTAVVGNVGHERRLDYTAIGDTVNTSARLEAMTKEVGTALLVSRSTVALLDEPLRERALLIGDVTVKGKARPVEVWALRPNRPDRDGVDDEQAA